MLESVVVVAMFINQLATEFRSKINSGACEGGGGDLQNRRIFDKVDGAVGGARGESGLYSVQPSVCCFCLSSFFDSGQVLLKIAR